MLKRIFDFLICFLALILLSPLFFLVSIIVKLTSKGPIFYLQERIGKDEKPFFIYKFRSMKINADKSGPLITTSTKDPRITRTGSFLRKFKLDELPQLINVIKGDMGLVGPRPEVKKYVDLYSNEQKKVFLLRPGITDLASIKYSNENEILETKNDPEEYYVKVLMQEKLKLNLEYLENASFLTDINLIFKTVQKVFGPTQKNL
jgi:lipopolysaccharide/colanic/teichoic acid biosynthesis glycosyltransferase